MEKNKYIARIVDVCTFHNEYDLFDIRYNILKDYVDEFIVVEFDKTFSGKDKTSLFPEKYKYSNVNYNYFNSDWAQQKYEELAKSSPNTEYGKGADHWIREFAQKESIKDCLTHLKDDDIVFIGDCDEIWEWSPFAPRMTTVNKLKLRVYSYYLNQRSDEQFWGTIVGHWRDIKGKCLNHLRTKADKLDKNMGWHFTSIGGYEKVKQKLEDSYTNETYANEAVLTHLKGNIEQNKDFLGRNFNYWLDESEWPSYLQSNRQKYKHLLK